MTKIFSVFHKEYFYAENEVITPIQVGAAISKEKLPMINDAIGDSISEKNKNYCELTALYWIWKNYFPKPDYIGLCHYRRYFLFDEKYYDQTQITSKNSSETKILENSLFDQNYLEDVTDRWDIILPSPTKLGSMSIRQQYALCHNLDHFDKMIEIMKKLHPEESSIIDIVSNANYLHCFSMFVMKKEIFEEYMEFLFEILFELENIIEIPSDSYQQRVFGFLGERILNYFVQIYKSKKMIKIKHYPVLFLDYNHNHNHNYDLNSNIFSIWYILPRNEQYNQVMEDTALCLQEGFKNLGFEVPIVHEKEEISGICIVLGCNFIPMFYTKKEIEQLPDSLIMYNLEVYERDSKWFNDVYLNLLKRFMVWDYSHQNIFYLKQLGINNITYCGLGYEKILTKIDPSNSLDEDIDVLFYGSINPYRQKIIDELIAKGVRVVVLFGVYGKQRDDYIARAKIVINIHYYSSSKIFEIVRIRYLLSNNRFVVSESGNDKLLEKPYEEGVVFCEYENLANTCIKYLADKKGRIDIAKKGFEIIKKQTQSDYILQALKGSKIIQDKFYTHLPDFMMASNCDYTIFIASPEGYVHSRAFEEIAILLKAGFEKLGFSAEIKTDKDQIKGQGVVLGANLLSGLLSKEEIESLPKDLILFNLEVIERNSAWIKDEYIEILKQFRVWDYSQKNITALEEYGVKNITFCGLGYEEEICKIVQKKEEEKDIDILFYGSMNEYRQKILDSLSKEGMRVVFLSSMYGSQRDEYIARAKIVLNIHYYFERKIFEIARVGYLLANGCFVISESGNDPLLENPYKDGLIFCPYEEIVNKCKKYINNPKKRFEIGKKAKEIAKRYLQRDFLKQALKGDKMAKIAEDKAKTKAKTADGKTADKKNKTIKDKNLFEKDMQDMQNVQDVQNMQSQDFQNLLAKALKLHQNSNFKEAKKIYLELLGQDKNNADVNHLLGLILKNEGELDEGIELMEKAVRLSPSGYVYYFNLARAYDERQDTQKSVECFRKAIELNPQYAEAWFNIGVVLEQQNNMQSAVEAYLEALKIEPNNEKYRFNLSIAYFRNFEIDKGWEPYKARYAPHDGGVLLELPKLPKPHYTSKSAPLDGKNLLVYAEQGLGDTFNFIRYLPLIKDRFKLKNVYFVPQIALYEPLKHMEGWLNADIAPALIDESKYDYAITLLDLPWLFESNMENIPFREKYIFAQSQYVQKFKNAFFQNDSLKVGLVWRGRPTHKNDQKRSVSFDLFVPLLETPNTILYSLQKENFDEAKPYFDSHSNFIDLSLELNTFADTMGAIANLDIVISVDTSVAHLACAMGKECWIALPYTPDWRWGAIDSESKNIYHQKYENKSYWYDSSRLYRQKKDKNYETIFKDIVADLQVLALKYKPISAENYQKGIELLNQAFAFHTKSDLENAKKLYLKTLQIYPSSDDAYHLLGVIYKNEGEIQKGIEYIKKAISLNPSNYVFYKNLGNALIEQENPQEALKSFEKALELEPNIGEVLFSAGKIAQELEDNEKARVYYERLLSIEPACEFGLKNMAILEKVERNYQKSLQYYQKILEILPNDPTIYLNMGGAYMLLDNQEKELECYEKSTQIDPLFAKGYISLFQFYEKKGEWLKALKYIKEAIKLNPDNNAHQTELLRFKSLSCDWSEIDELKKKVLEASSSEEGKVAVGTQHAVMYMGSLSDEKKLLDVAKKFVKHREKAIFAVFLDLKYDFEKLKNQIINSKVKVGTSGKKIKIGYVSGDFYNHATLHLLVGIFEYHDKEKFEITAYSLFHKEGSSYYDRLMNSIDRFVDLSDMSLRQICDKIYEDEIDILVDLKGYTHDAKPEIFMIKPAPVQISWLGMPATTGMESMDYIVADKIVIPEENQQFYTEKMFYMPNCYQPNDEKQIIDSQEISRQECFLPQEAFVFCDFNNPYKIDSQTFDLWMEILKQAPDSVLWQYVLEDAIKDNLRDEASKRGVDPQRLIFASVAIKEKHLKRMQLADLFLDTINCNAHTTASDSVFTGLPLLSMLGNTFAKRVAASILTNVGMEELIVSNTQEYMQKALYFYHNKNELLKIRKRLVNNIKTYSLYDTKKFAYYLEKGYEMAYKNFILEGKAKNIIIEED